MSETLFTSHECNLEMYYSGLKSGIKAVHVHTQVHVHFTGVIQVGIRYEFRKLEHCILTVIIELKNKWLRGLGIGLSE